MNERILINIGKKIKELRLQKDLKVHELADLAQITKGMLSKIENGRTVPSLPLLFSVIQALDIDLKTFFEDIEVKNGGLFLHKKKEDYSILQKEDSPGFLYHFILAHSSNQFLLEAMVLDLAPNTEREVLTTDGFEFKYILKGEVTYLIGESEIILQEGDSLFFDGRIPHTPKNRTDLPASMLVLYLFAPKTEETEE